MNIIFTPEQVLRYLLVILFGLLLASISVDILRLMVGLNDETILLYKFFDFNHEKSIPTLFSVLLLLGSSVLLFMIGLFQKVQKASFYYWLGLSFIFLFLTLDEFLEIHENLEKILHQYYGHSGVFHFSWIVPYAIFFLIISFAYLRFLLNLPSKTMWMFIISGTIYVTGALGMESLGGWYIESHGEDNVIYCLIYTLEEFLEMFGISLFIYSILSFNVEHLSPLSFSLEKKPVGNF